MPDLPSADVHTSVPRVLRCLQLGGRRTALSEVSSAGLRTTVLPAVRAGASFHELMSSGKFQGMIAPRTPTSSCRGPGEGLTQGGKTGGVLQASFEHQPPKYARSPPPARVDVERLRQRLPIVQGFQSGELLRAELGEYQIKVTAWQICPEWVMR